MPVCHLSCRDLGERLTSDELEEFREIFNEAEDDEFGLEDEFEDAPDDDDDDFEDEEAVNE